MDCIATSVVDFDEVKQEVKKESKKGIKEAAPRMKTRNKMANPSLYSYVSYLPVLSRFWCTYTLLSLGHVLPVFQVLLKLAGSFKFGIEEIENDYNNPYYGT